MKIKREAYSYLMMIGHACADLNTGALPAILPFLVAERGISLASVGGLTFAASAVGSVIQPVFGSLADKYSRPWLMSVGILLAGCGVSMIGFLDNYWAMFAAVALSGIGSAIFHPEAGRMANYVAGEHKGKGVSNFSVGGNIGGAAGPVLAALAISRFGMRGTALLFIPPLLMAIFMLFQCPTLAGFVREGQAQTAAAAAAGQKDDWVSFGKLSMTVFARSIVGTGMRTFIPLFWVAVLLQSETSAAATATILSVSGAVATFIGGRMADRYGFTTMIRIGLCALVPFLCLINLSRSIPVSTLLLVLAAAALNLAFSPSVALGQKFLPNRIGLASGITMGLAASFGGMISPLLGRIGDANGLPLVLWIIAGIAAVGAFISFFTPEPAKVQSKGPINQKTLQQS